MVLTRSQAAKIKADLIPLQDNPDAFAKKLKAEAEAKRVQDAETAAQLDELAGLFSSKVNMGESPMDAATAALEKLMGELAMGGRRKTRKGKSKKSKKSKKTRKH
jgi:hypothetical protein